MKDGELLFVDTTRAELFCAIVDVKSGRFEARKSVEQRRHSEVLNTVVGDWLARASGFAVVTGYGSWTGSRVGVVAVKAWAFATGKPIVELVVGKDEVVDYNGLVKAAVEKFKKGEFVDMFALAPKYDSEFKVTM